MHDGVCRTLPVDPPNGKSTPKLKTKHQSPFFKVEDYYCSDSSTSSPKKVAFSQFEVESSETIIMLAMMIGAMNFEEGLTSIKATLERLSKESAKKYARIKYR